MIPAACSAGTLTLAKYKLRIQWFKARQHDALLVPSLVLGLGRAADFLVAVNWWSYVLTPGRNHWAHVPCENPNRELGRQRPSMWSSLQEWPRPGRTKQIYEITKLFSQSTRALKARRLRCWEYHASVAVPKACAQAGMTAELGRLRTVWPRE